MKNIHVKRYNPAMPYWAGSVSPEDGSWVVFVGNDGEAFFYRRVLRETSNGKVEECYEDPSQKSC